MLIISNDLRTAIKDCLNQDKGLQVFQYYGFEPNNRKPQRENPFRQERTPSFFINWYNGAFRFKDFGDDDCKGDAWDFVKRMEGFQNNSDIWQRLAEIYGVWVGGEKDKERKKDEGLKNFPPLNPSTP